MSTKRRRKRKSLHLTDKKHPMLAIMATGLGIFSIILFCVFCFVSGTDKGKSGLLIGLGGLLCMGLSVIGFLTSWASLHQENIRPLFPTIASVVNGLCVVFYFVLYIYGMFM